ncbi:MAG: YdeI/OmpD-associated family protein [Bacteroidia bacterium]|jgi:hypothetical protein
MKAKSHHFTAHLDLIGINPFVFVPEPVLLELFKQAGKTKGPIPVAGVLNDKPFRQTLVKYKSHWRLYINTVMLKNSPKHVGEILHITLAFDPSNRSLTPHPKLLAALKLNPDALAVFEQLTASRRQEIIRYLAHLKTDESLERNVTRAIHFLNGNGRFVGRDKP